MFKNLMARLGVEFIAHDTNNSRAKGSVEQGNNLIETNFESLLSFKSVDSIEDLNAFANEWRMFNETGITAIKRTRNQVWSMIRPEQLRITPHQLSCAVSWLLHTCISHSAWGSHRTTHH